MTKMERAKRIWTHVTALSSERGFYEYVNSGRALVVGSRAFTRSSIKPEGVITRGGSALRRGYAICPTAWVFGCRPGRRF